MVVSFAASKFSQTLSPELNKSILDYKVILITCLWIPVVEELVYRRLFSRFLVDKNYLIWSCYLSALFFSINHSLLNANDFPINIISLPLGPFLLGAICQLLVLYSGSIISAVFFHIVQLDGFYIFIQ